MSVYNCEAYLRESIDSILAQTYSNWEFVICNDASTDGGVMVKVSIVIPVYNVESYLRQCVDSVLNQSFRNLELVLVDDGSKDSSPAICDEYAAKDSRVVVVHKANGGAAAARNDGIRMATGDYVTFLDSDDYWDEQDSLEKIVAKIVEDDADIVETSLKSIRQSDGVTNFSAEFPLERMRPHDTVNNLRVLIESTTYKVHAGLKMIRRSFLLAHELFFPVGVTCEDILWGVRISAAKPDISFLNLWTYAYREGRPGSVTSTIKEKNLQDYLFVLQEAYAAAETADKETAKLLRGYLLYQCMIAMALVENIKIPKSGKKAYRDRLKQLCIAELKEPAIHPKAAKCQRVYRLLGFRAMTLVLGKYLKYR